MSNHNLYDHTIYAHADTDGAISALLLKAQLLENHGPDFRVLVCPVDHGGGQVSPWSTRQLQMPCSIVDFSLHPSFLSEKIMAAVLAGGQAFAKEGSHCCYWIDHHATGAPYAFLTPENVQGYLPGAVLACWDPQASSTPALMREKRELLGLSETLLERYEYLIDMSDIVDSASYLSAADAHDHSQFSVRLRCLFSTNHPCVDRGALYVRFVDELLKVEDGEFGRAFDADPLFEAVIVNEERVHHRRMVAYRGCSQQVGNVAVCDFRGKPDAWLGIGRFVPYELFPECTHALHVAPPKESGYAAVTCGENPWNRGGSALHLGEYFAAHFGGGGHAFVAGGRMQPDSDELLERLIGELSRK